MSTTPIPDSPLGFPHVHPWQADIIARYEDRFNNTGGNEALDLLNDLQGPRGERMISTNIVRYLLAFAVSSQVQLIATLTKEGALAEPEQDREQWWSTIAAERDRQVAKGYGPAHDDEHGVRHLLNWAIEYGRRGKTVEASALASAAMDSLDRRGIDA